MKRRTPLATGSMVASAAKVCAASIAAAVALLACANVSAQASEKQTIGLVLTEWHLATHETPDAKAECPSGFQYGNVDNWKAIYKTPAEQEAMLRKYGFTQSRGKNGENIFVYPETGADPLPFREVANDVGYGMDLDGVPSGEATSKTCAHKNFTSPAGRANIDNQLYRALGCQKALRRGGFFDARFSEEKKMRISARWLVEISEVDDVQNDDHVIVSTFKGRDKLVVDAAQNVVPWGTQRVDERGPRYMQQTTGKIVNGVLVSDPVNLLFSTATHNLAGETAINDARLELQLKDTTADGLIVGYHDLKRWWKQYAKQSISREHVTPVSGPSVYQAAKRLADGHKDEGTGECTSISAAYDVKFTRAYIVRSPAGGALANNENAGATTQSKGVAAVSAAE